MISTHFIKCIVLGCLFVSSQWITAAGIEKQIINGDQKINGKLNNNKTIELQISKLKAQKFSSEALDDIDSDEGWRAEKNSTVDGIFRLALKVNGKFVQFPASVAVGVPYPDRINLWSQGDLIYLQLSLGDGGRAYDLTLKLLPSKKKPGCFRVSERVFRSRVFPSEIWEKTEYHDKRWDGDF